MIGPYIRLQPPRTAGSVARLRREVAAWARSTAICDRMLEDLSLVLTELATNAVRHGSGRRMSVVVGRIGDRIDLRVHDAGPGPAAPPDGDEHGRGLAIVRALADHLTLEHGPDGTVAHVRLTIRPANAAATTAATLPPVPGP